MKFCDSCMRIRRMLHDLSQPLAVLTGLVDLMLLEMDERDHRFREVRMMSQQLEQVLRIVGEIRHVALEATDTALHPRGVPQAH